MFNSAVLSIAISLVFLYLVVAVIVTGINDIWFTFSRKKAKKLEEFLSNFFFDDEWRQDIYSKFGDSPFIQVLKKKESKFPGAIPASNFVKSVLTIIGEGKSDLSTITAKVNAKANKGGFYKLLDSFLSQNITIEKLQVELEKVFDTSMERLTGWYKRYAKILSFFVGFVICAALNLDTINISVRLWNDKQQAEKIASFAVDISKNFEKDATGKIVFKQESGDQMALNVKDTVVNMKIKKESGSADSTNIMVPVRTIERSYTVMSESGIPVGWSKENMLHFTNNGSYSGILGWLIKILGILLSAFAVSLGAPFWFDVLSKVTPLKKAGTASETPPPTKN